jgi:hypothetical protein
LHVWLKEGAYRVLVGKPGEIEHFENLGLDKRVILKWLLKKSFGKTWTGLIFLSIS